jgi:hypothetical protein
MTQRQFLAWGEWLLTDANEADKATSYVMQLTAEVARGHAKHPKEVKTADFRIPFERVEAGANKQRKAEAESGVFGHIRAERAKRKQRKQT